jgi:hypothetical protein
MLEPVTIPLSKPITVIDQEYTSVTLRPPVAKDINKAGYPLKFTAEGGTDVVAPAMSRMIATLGGIITPENVDGLPAYDWQQCCLTVMGFFAPPAGVKPLLDTIKFKEPTGKDIAEAGYPLKFSPAGTDIDAVAMSRMIGVLTGLGADDVDRIAGYDWQDCCLTVVGFFAPPATRKISSGDTSNSPAGGAT